MVPIARVSLTFITVPPKSGSITLADGPPLLVDKAAEMLCVQGYLVAKHVASAFGPVAGACVLPRPNAQRVVWLPCRPAGNLM